MGISRQEYWSRLPFPSPIMLVYLLVYLSRQHTESCHKQTTPNSERNTQTPVKFENRARGMCRLLWGVWVLGAAGEGLLLSWWPRANHYLGDLGILQKDKYPGDKSSFETSARESLLHLTLWSCAWLLLEMHTFHPWNFPELHSWTNLPHVTFTLHFLSALVFKHTL